MCYPVLPGFFSPTGYLMDNVISRVTMLGVPGLVILIASDMYGKVRTTAILMALSIFLPGPLFLVAGFTAIGLYHHLKKNIRIHGLDPLVEGTLAELYVKGQTPESIASAVEKYPVPNALKERVLGFVMD